MIGFIIGGLLATIIVGPVAYVIGRTRGLFVAARRAVEVARRAADHADDLRAAVDRAWAWADDRRRAGRTGDPYDGPADPF